MVLIPPTRGVLQNLSQREIEYLELLAQGGNDSVDTIDEIANLQQGLSSNIAMNASLINKLTQALYSLDNKNQALQSMLSSLSAQAKKNTDMIKDLDNKVSAVASSKQKTPQGALNISAPDSQSVASATTDIIDVFNAVALQNLANVSTVSNAVVVQKSGVYTFSYVANLEADVNNVLVRVAGHRNNAELSQLVYEQLIQNSNTVFNVSISMPVIASAGDSFDLRISHDNGGAVNFDFDEITFALIGEKI